MPGYDGGFYDTIRGGSYQSAQIVVPQILEWIQGYPRSTMIDVGCGEGWWAKEFTRHGLTALGIDGEYVDAVQCDFRAVDLTKTIPHLGTFDIALSLEVAEHLPDQRAQRFVHDLCRLAPIVIFSAAIPGQGGTGHVNEQWPDYWYHLFEAEGFVVDSGFRYTIWDDDRIENWYRQNILICISNKFHGNPHERGYEGIPLRMVHEVLWSHRMGL